MPLLVSSIVYRSVHAFYGIMIKFQGSIEWGEVVMGKNCKVISRQTCSNLSPPLPLSRENAGVIFGRTISTLHKYPAHRSKVLNRFPNFLLVCVKFTLARLSPYPYLLCFCRGISCVRLPGTRTWSCSWCPRCLAAGRITGRTPNVTGRYTGTWS